MPETLPIVHVDRPLTEADRRYAGDRATIVGPTDDELPGAVASVIGVAHRWDADRFTRFPDLRVVSRMGIGYDNIDVAAATAAGVVICNAPDAPTVSTAEHTLALMLAITKELPDLRDRADAGERGRAAPSALELDGATLGLVGLGRIGRRVAVGAIGLGMRVVAFDPAIDAPPDDLPIELVSLDEVLTGADVISLHAPATEATHHLVRRETIASMKPGVFIVNCSRGTLVDQDALVVALDAGQVAGAALDVTVPEPLPIGHALLGRSDVIVTPHVASATTAGRERLFAHAFDNAIAVLEGRPATIVTDSPT